MEFTFNNPFKKKPAPAPVEPRPPHGDEALRFTLPEPPVSFGAHLSDLRQRQGQESLVAEQALRNVKIRDAIPSIFDVADFDVVLRRLQELAGINPDLFIFRSKSGFEYTVSTLVDLFNKVKRQQEAYLKTNELSSKTYSKEELVQLSIQIGQLGVTTDKIDSSSSLGLRECLVRCAQKFCSQDR